jgi:hypothetical protein
MVPLFVGLQSFAAITVLLTRLAETPPSKSSLLGFHAQVRSVQARFNLLPRHVCVCCRIESLRHRVCCFLFLFLFVVVVVVSFRSFSSACFPLSAFSSFFSLSVD